MGVDDRFGRFLAAVGGVLALVAVAIVMVAGNAEAAADEQYMPGQPLDAVRMDPPAFATGNYCYRVTDRTNGASWYLIQMPDGDGHWRWQVLTIGVGQASPGLIVPNNESAETE